MKINSFPKKIVSKKTIVKNKEIIIVGISLDEQYHLGEIEKKTRIWAKSENDQIGKLARRDKGPMKNLDKIGKFGQDLFLEHNFIGIGSHLPS